MEVFPSFYRSVPVFDHHQIILVPGCILDVLVEAIVLVNLVNFAIISDFGVSDYYNLLRVISDY